MGGQSGLLGREKGTRYRVTGVESEDPRQTNDEERSSKAKVKVNQGGVEEVKSKEKGLMAMSCCVVFF